MIKVIGKPLKAFDKGRQVQIMSEKGVRIRTVYFERSGIQYESSIDSECIANIPDVLLMTHGVLKVKYEGICSDGFRVIEKQNFEIDNAKRPADYVEPEIPQQGGVTKQYVDNMFAEYIEQVAELIGGEA